MTHIIKPFGRARELFETHELCIQIPDGLTINGLKTELVNYIKPEVASDKAEAILATCAIANENKILNEKDNLASHKLLALLPPVCGG